MLKPSATELMKSKKIDSKYTLVIATAKRAREIFSKKSNVFVDCDSDKPVSIAVNEIAENKVTLKTAKSGYDFTSEAALNDILEQEANAEKLEEDVIISDFDSEEGTNDEDAQ